jgi:hypothetical protein
MKTMKMLFALSLIISAVGLNAATDYSADAKAWISKNNGMMSGTNFYFANKMPKNMSITVPGTGRFNLAKDKDVKVSGKGLGKLYQGQEIEITAGNVTVRIPTLTEKGSPILYHVVGSGPTLYSYAQDGSALERPLIGY